jgi:hypothetical protein
LPPLTVTTGSVAAAEAGGSGSVSKANDRATSQMRVMGDFFLCGLRFLEPQCPLEVKR